MAKKKRKNVESTVQIAYVSILRQLAENYPLDSVIVSLADIYSIANGGYRTASEAKRLKDEGVVAGMPDLHLPVSNGAYATLYQEGKTETNTTSAVQVETHRKLRKYNHKVTVFHSLEEALQQVAQYFKRPDIYEKGIELLGGPL